MTPRYTLPAARLSQMIEQIGCVACSGHNVYLAEQWPMGDGVNVMACRDCGLLFIHPAPPEPPTTGEDVRSHSTRDLPSLTMPPGNKGAAGALIAALNQYLPASCPPAGARLLDFGCRTGGWLNPFQHCGWETFGIESSSDVAFARHTRLKSVPPDPQFDLVILYQVLQRLPRPLDALHKLSRAMRPGGHLLVSVPRLDTVAVHGDIRSCLAPRKNIAAFTESCLRGLLARAGLEVVAALHALDTAFSHGKPVRLRLLARKVDAVAPGPDPAAALPPIFQALSTLGSRVKAPPRLPSEPTSCPACDGSNARLIKQWRFSKVGACAAACMDCGLLFVHPQPSQEALNALYTPDSYLEWKASRLADKAWKTATGGSRSTRKRRTPMVFTTLDRFLSVTTPAAGARVLDFGCGPGTWLDAFQDHGWDTYGIEPCTDAAFVRHQRLLTAPSEPQFDLVFLHHVLEHLPRPLDTLREVAQALLPGGYCFVSVPRLDTVGVHRQPKYCLCPPHHIVGFTESCLRGLLARAGLEVVAAFNDHASAAKKGSPTKLQLLARKAAAPPAPEPDPASALTPVIETVIALKKTGAVRRYQPPG